MLSEMAIVSLTLMLSIQASALWSSLLIIPISMLVMMSFNMSNHLSGMLVFLFIMVFIGGLMVLLVSVASTTFQEQGISLSMVTMLAPLLTLLMVSETLANNTESSIVIMQWLEFYKMMVLLLTIICLMTSLMVMTTLMLEFKGMTRSS